jgi:hypothetical protein
LKVDKHGSNPNLRGKLPNKESYSSHKNHFFQNPKQRGF